MNIERGFRQDIGEVVDDPTAVLCLSDVAGDIENEVAPNESVPRAESDLNNSLQYVDMLAASDNPSLTLRLSKQISKDRSENGPYFTGPQKYLRTQCEFTPSVQSFLNRYSRRYPPEVHADGAKTYTIPIYGISNRSIGNDSDFEPKFFMSEMHIKVPKGAHNFDQCTISRGPRELLSGDQYRKAVQQELSGAHDLLPQTGPLSFFTHGVFAAAGQSDDDVMRIAAESGVPTINIDWRSTPGSLWTKLFRYGVDFSGAINQEKAFEPYLDQTVAWLNPSRCAFVAFSRGSAFNAAYMKHRHETMGDLNTKKLNGDLFAHPDLETEKFRVRDDKGRNFITASAENTVVLGSPKDKALMFASRWLRGDRVGDAGKQDIDAVIKAGGRYLIDEFPKRGANFHHFINYRSLGTMVRDLLHTKNRGDKPVPVPCEKNGSLGSPDSQWQLWLEPKEAVRYVR
ncbi:MAG: hypothetical protein K2X77_15825 [Candidatus Obscuribacterales bacterium]|jgi:hypothetical protein|nr:hypothetical protein [Candidatus Obscuribacterales bacterium]